MFEKEAIRHAFECTIGVECLNKPVEDFTYEELNDEQQEKAYDFQKGAELGYNNANEWHYPSKGEYPKECEDVLCYCKVADAKFCSIGHTIIGGDNKIKWWSSNRKEELEVYAWKEIILPKEIKENAELKEQVENPKLNKAKEIIKDYLTIVKGSHTTVCGVPEENRTIHVLKLNKEAEQLITKDSEVENDF